MASFKAVPKPSLEKDLRSLPKSIIIRVMKEIEELATDPLPRKAIKLEGGEDYIGCASETTELFMESIAPRNY